MKRRHIHNLLLAACALVLALLCLLTILAK